MLGVAVRDAIDPGDQLQAGPRESGDLMVRVQEAEDQLNRLAPPLGHRDHVSGLVIGVADMKGDQGMATALEYPSQLGVRSLAIVIIEVDDRVQTDDCSCRSGPDRQCCQVASAGGTLQVRQASAAIASERSSPITEERSAR